MSAGDMGKVLGKRLKAGEDPAVQAEAKAAVAAALKLGLAAFGEPPVTNQPPRHKKATPQPPGTVAFTGAKPVHYTRSASAPQWTGKEVKVVELHPECPLCRKRKPYCKH